MLRMHAALVPVPGARPEPPHPDAADGYVAVTVDRLHWDTGLASGVFTRPTTSGTTGEQTLLEYFVRPLLRVFRVSLEAYGWPLVDPALGGFAFELTRDHAPTGRVLLAGPPPGHVVPASRLAAIDTLVTAFTRVRRWPAETAVRRLIDDVIAAELRYLQPATAAALAGEPCWSQHVHSVPVEQEAALERVVARVRSRAAAHRSDRAAPAPVVRVAHAGAAAPAGLARFGREIFHFGAELHVVPHGAAGTEPDVAVGRGAPVRTFERAPRTWREPSSRAPHLSQASSIAGLRLGELRTNLVSERFAVRWTGAETDALVARLVAAAGDAADRTAAKALATHGSGQYCELIRDVLQRDHFRGGRRSDYSLDHARADLLPTVTRGAPLHVAMLIFPNKFGHSRLKADGLLPDLAELATLARIAELVATLQRVYPHGIRFSLVSDGEHNRRHPHARMEAGMATLRTYARAVAGDAIDITDLDTEAAGSMSDDTLAAYAREKARIRAEYVHLYRHLDITADPVGVLREIAEVDPHRTFAEMFRSIVHSVPVPAGIDSKAVYDDIYDVGREVDAAVARTRREILRTTWDDVLDYTSAYVADLLLDHRGQAMPGTFWLTARQRRGRPGFRPLGHGPTPAHSTGAVDARGIICCDFHVSLTDQGFVPLYSPLLGADQPFAMVPITATRVGADGTNQLDPDFAAGIRLRQR